MKRLKLKYLKGVHVLAIVTFGLASMAMAKSTVVYTYNATGKSWLSKECIKSNCSAFAIAPQQFHLAEIPVPSTGTVNLQAIFGSSGTITPLYCNALFDVQKSSVALISVYGSSNTYHCNVSPR